MRHFFIFCLFMPDFTGFPLLPCRLSVHVVTPSGVKPSHANRGEWCAAAILTDHHQPNTQKYSDDACRPSRNRTWYHAFRGGRCAAAILTDRQQPKNKNTWIMIFYSSRIVIRDNSLST